MVKKLIYYNIISYQQILEKFFRSIDPLDAVGQFCDRGNQYRSAIFYLNQKQHDIAIIERNKVAKLLGAEIATNITEVLTFYPAEDYHQNYHLRNPIRYKYYRHSCGRDKRLKILFPEDK